MHNRKKNAFRVDLTPMVDLGFLLITFFMLSSAWTTPHVIRLILPANGDSNKIGDGSVLTLLAAGKDSIFYYNGDLEGSLKSGSFGITGYSVEKGIGEVIRNKQSMMDRFHKGGRRDLMVIIKASENASFRELMQLMDQMLIHQVARYAIVDISPVEMDLLEMKLN
jgi:biopolymer transport protein ExbD